jgi:hypothetical protein
MKNQMDQAAVIEKLRAGYELANHGYGWRLVKSGKSYKSAKSAEIESSTVTALLEAGVITVETLTLSLRARGVAEHSRQKAHSRQ